MSITFDQPDRRLEPRVRRARDLMGGPLPLVALTEVLRLRLVGPGEK